VTRGAAKPKDWSQKGNNHPKGVDIKSSNP